jgi:hypothetical protein
MPTKKYPSIILLLALCSLLSSCSSMITSRLIEPLAGNIQQQTDVDLVCEGTPAFLLMLDSMLVSSPESTSLLLSATQSYIGYASALQECGLGNELRIAAIAEKAKIYGKALLSSRLSLDNDDEKLAQQLQKESKADVPELFWGAMGWLTWVQSQQGSPASIADMVAIEKIMVRVLELDPAYQGGSVHLFFGIYYAMKPEMFGGRPDLSRSHFEAALRLSGRQFLLTQTSYAETLARATMDQQLHDSLLEEVVAFPVDTAPEYGLSNRIAQRKARKLLDENYFGE